ASQRTGAFPRPNQYPFDKKRAAANSRIGQKKFAPEILRKRVG
ncbi:MAG: hypothetical protein ACJAYA_001092, partial [Bacteroidia bacterium]